MSKEKIYLNGIPVYRTEEVAAIKYILFEDNENGSVLYINNTSERDDEYQVVMNNIKDMFGKPHGRINVSVIEYEQSRRSNEWILKPSKGHAWINLGGEDENPF
jgi:hypothetical protein